MKAEKQRREELDIIKFCVVNVVILLVFIFYYINLYFRSLYQPTTEVDRHFFMSLH